MRIGIFLGHPAHYHLFKYTIENLRNKGHSIDILVKRKDILESLVQEAGLDYIVVREHERLSSSKINIIWETVKMDLKVCKYLIRKRPSLMIGTYAPLFSGYLGIPIIVCNEDDADAVPRFAKVGYPRADAILTPSFCNCGKWEFKAIKYKGYQKLAYLHPNEFTPNLDTAQKYLRNKNKPYVLMRFSRFNAHHDDGAHGMSNQLAQRIISLLSDEYDVYITSERTLDASLEKYCLHINQLDIHHLMAFASLYVGDSQSMSVEAAMLGVPCIRFNSFVGKLKVGVLEELEGKYHLIKSIHSSKPEELIETIHRILNSPSEKEMHLKRKNRMLTEKIDVTAFFTWLIDNYPDSLRQMRKNPEIQNQFQ
mgnify:CR=1 FL=1